MNFELFKKNIDYKKISEVFILTNFRYSHFFIYGKSYIDSAVTVISELITIYSG